MSINGGESWTSQDYPTSQFYHVMATSDVPYHVVGAQQDNSTLAMPSDGWDFMQARDQVPIGTMLLVVVKAVGLPKVQRIPIFLCRKSRSIVNTIRPKQWSD